MGLGMENENDEWIVLISDSDDITQQWVSTPSSPHSSSPSNRENDFLAHAILTERLVTYSTEKEQYDITQASFHSLQTLTSAVESAKGYITQRTHYIILAIVVLQCFGSIVYFSLWCCKG